MSEELNSEQKTETKSQEATEQQDTATKEQAPESKPLTVDDIKTPIDAYDVLLQAAESGRKNGIFSFEELEIISKSIKIARTDLNAKAFKAKMQGNIFLLPEEVKEGDENPATKSDFSELTAGIKDEERTSIGFEAVKMDSSFVCFANNEQFTGQKGDFLVKISDSFYLPIKAISDTKSEDVSEEVADEGVK